MKPCIIKYQKQISEPSGLNLGVIQIGPNGQIYFRHSAIIELGRISVVTGFTATSFLQQSGVKPMHKNIQLGPTFNSSKLRNLKSPNLLHLHYDLPLTQIIPTIALLEGGEPDYWQLFRTITKDMALVYWMIRGPGKSSKPRAVFWEPGTNDRLRRSLCDPRNFRRKHLIYDASSLDITCSDAANVSAEILFTTNCHRWLWNWGSYNDWMDMRAGQVNLVMKFEYITVDIE